MTPPPASAAARPLAPPAPRRRSQTSKGRSAPKRPPRRYSGPARGMASAAVAAPAITLPARPQPRRQAPARRVRNRSLRLLGVALPSPRQLVELVLAGRTWIGVVAFALIGIVTMQLMVLRLNTGIGQSLQRAAALQREDDSLAITNSEAGSGESVEAQARALGMTSVPPGELRFLPAAPAARAGAVANLLLSTEAFTATGLGSAATATSPTSYVTPAGGETTLSPAPSGGQPNPEGSASQLPASQAPASPASQTSVSQAPIAPTSASQAPTSSQAAAEGQGVSAGQEAQQAGATAAPSGAGG